MKESGEVFAEYTASRLDKALRSEPLTSNQREIILATLSAQEEGVRHSLDVRISIPLFFRSYYLVLFAGRDRRRTTLELQTLRYRRSMRGILRYFSISALILLSFGVGLGLLYGAYLIKSALGLDLIQGFHLSDIIG